MQFKEIKLLPSYWILEVVYYPHSSQDKLNQWISARYGIPISELEDETNVNACLTLSSSNKSELKGHTRVLIVVNDLNDHGLIVHELLHALWHYSRCSGVQMNYDSQEWQALHLEYTFNEIINPKTWIKIPLKSIQ